MTIAAQDYIVQAIVAILLFLLTLRIVKLVSSVTTTLVQLAILLLAALLIVQYALQRNGEEAWSNVLVTLSSLTGVMEDLTNIPSAYNLLQSTKNWFMEIPVVSAIFTNIAVPPPPPPPPTSFVPQWMQNVRLWN